MTVAIVGAGIGGLTLAAMLTRAGIACQVFEQAGHLTEIGAGLQLAPYAARILCRLGVRDDLDTDGVRPAATELRRWSDGQLLSRTELGVTCARYFGAAYYTIHRAHLHRALTRLVSAHSVHLGTRVVRATTDEREARLFFADGSSIAADVVVGADGIRSRVREVIANDAPVPAKITVYRALVEAGRLAQQLRDHSVQLWLGPGQHAVRYPISSGKLVSLAATVPGATEGQESWTAEGSAQDLVAAYEGWHEGISGVARAVGTVKCWALHDRDPLARWTHGRITLLGDAAHPALPFLAQGAGQAIEDAAALAVCLATTRDIDEALRRYEDLRTERTALIQSGSRLSATTLHLPDGTDQQDRDEALDTDVGPEHLAWLYGYDAEWEAHLHA